VTGGGAPLLDPALSHILATTATDATPGAKTERLRSLKPFILDTSIAASTFLRPASEVPAIKQKVVEFLEGSGVHHVAVAVFTPQRCVDAWLERRGRHAGPPQRLFAVLEMPDVVAEGVTAALPPFWMSTPSTVRRCGIGNCVIEMDVLRHFGGPGPLRGEHAPAVAVQAWLRLARSLSKDAQVFVQYNDGLDAWQTDAGRRRLLQATGLLAGLAPAPAGLIIRDARGEGWPEEFGHMARALRAVMAAGGWAAGHLLLNAGKGYGLAQAGVFEALASGFTGLCACASEDRCRAGPGQASYLMALTNLVRLGNPHVAGLFDLPRLCDLAVAVAALSGTPCSPNQELYGPRAHDLFFDPAAAMGLGAFDAPGLLGRARSTRISTFTTPGMFRAGLDEVFGRRDWNPVVVEAMRVELHEDLVNGKKLTYQTPSGLFDLYDRAGGTDFLEDMAAVVAAATAQLRRHRLMKALRRKFDECGRAGDGAARGDVVSKRAFFEGFLAGRPPPFEAPEVQAALALMDFDESGSVDWAEVALRGVWVLEQFPAIKALGTFHEFLEAMIDHLLEEAEEAAANKAQRGRSEVRFEMFVKEAARAHGGGTGCPGPRRTA